MTHCRVDGRVVTTILRSFTTPYNLLRPNGRENIWDVTNRFLRVRGCFVSWVCITESRLLGISWGINKIPIVNNNISHIPETCETLTFEVYLLLWHCFNLSPLFSPLLNGTVKIVFWAKSMGKSKTRSAFPVKHQQFPQIGDFPPSSPTFLFFLCFALDRNC